MGELLLLWAHPPVRLLVLEKVFEAESAIPDLTAEQANREVPRLRMEMLAHTTAGCGFR